MKKLTLFLICIILVFSLTACSNTAKEEESTQEQSTAQTIETTTSGEIKGLLYAVIEGKDTRTNEFMCTGGTLTPERIAAGFTGWTGINFGITSATDENSKTITIKWKDSSAIVTKSTSANEGFEFASYDEMKTFMQNSLTETIVKNMGEYTVIYE